MFLCVFSCRYSDFNSLPLEKLDSINLSNPFMHSHFNMHEADYDASLHLVLWYTYYYYYYY